MKITNQRSDMLQNGFLYKFHQVYHDLILDHLPVCIS